MGWYSSYFFYDYHFQDDEKGRRWRKKWGGGGKEKWNIGRIKEERKSEKKEEAVEEMSRRKRIKRRWRRRKTRSNTNIANIWYKVTRFNTGREAPYRQLRQRDVLYPTIYIQWKSFIWRYKTQYQNQPTSSSRLSLSQNLDIMELGYEVGYLTDPSDIYPRRTKKNKNNDIK